MARTDRDRPSMRGRAGPQRPDVERRRRRQGTPGIDPARSMAIVFVLFAIGDLAWLIANANFAPNPSLQDIAVYLLQILPGVVAILFPAALLARHPDATTKAPVLLLGTILFAIVQALLLVAAQLEPIFETLTPASAEVSFVPLSVVFKALTLLTGVCGLGFMARGLSLARRYVDRPFAPIEWFVPVAAIFATVVGILAVSKLPLPDPTPPSYFVYVGANVVLGILRVVVWAYLLTAALRGWLAGEDPSQGWGLAALAGGVVVLALALANVGGAIEISDQTLATAYGWIIIVSYAAGHLGLLAAFLLGLPSLAEPDEDEVDDENASGDEDEVDDDDAFDDEAEFDEEDEIVPGRSAR